MTRMSLRDAPDIHASRDVFEVTPKPQRLPSSVRRMCKRGQRDVTEHVQREGIRDQGLQTARSVADAPLVSLATRRPSPGDPGGEPVVSAAREEMF
jgi:hypothetical protein